MAKVLTMWDIAAMEENNHVYVVVELSLIPKVAAITTSYNQARSVSIMEENNVMLALSPETITRVKSGELLEIKV